MDKFLIPFLAKKSSADDNNKMASNNPSTSGVSVAKKRRVAVLDEKGQQIELYDMDKEVEDLLAKKTKIVASPSVDKKKTSIMKEESKITAVLKAIKAKIGYGTTADEDDDMMESSTKYQEFVKKNKWKKVVDLEVLQNVRENGQMTTRKIYFSLMDNRFRVAAALSNAGYLQNPTVKCSMQNCLFAATDYKQGKCGLHSEGHRYVFVIQDINNKDEIAIAVLSPHAASFHISYQSNSIENYINSKQFATDYAILASYVQKRKDDGFSCKMKIIKKWQIPGVAAALEFRHKIMLGISLMSVIHNSMGGKLVSLKHAQITFANVSWGEVMDILKENGFNLIPGLEDNSINQSISPCIPSVFHGARPYTYFNHVDVFYDGVKTSKLSYHTRGTGSNAHKTLKTGLSDQPQQNRMPIYQANNVLLLSDKDADDDATQAETFGHISTNLAKYFGKSFNGQPYTEIRAQKYTHFDNFNDFSLLGKLFQFKSKCELTIERGTLVNENGEFSVKLF